MKKIFLILYFIAILGLNSFAMDFNKNSDKSAESILSEFIKENSDCAYSKIIAHYLDIDSDNKKEIIGVVKSPLFYDISGYKLFVLKENKNSWQSIKSDVIFDTDREIEFKNNKIIYQKALIYGNKKYKAKIKNNEIITKKSCFDIKKDKKLRAINLITEIKEGKEQKRIDLADFGEKKQRSVNISYPNLNEKTKHYLDLK